MRMPSGSIDNCAWRLLIALKQAFSNSPGEQVVWKTKEDNVLFKFHKILGNMGYDSTMQPTGYEEADSRVLLLQVDEGAILMRSVTGNSVNCCFIGHKLLDMNNLPENLRGKWRSVIKDEWGDMNNPNKKFCFRVVINSHSDNGPITMTTSKKIPFFDKNWCKASEVIFDALIKVFDKAPHRVVTWKGAEEGMLIKLQAVFQTLGYSSDLRSSEYALSDSRNLIVCKDKKSILFTPIYPKLINCRLLNKNYSVLT